MFFGCLKLTCGCLNDKLNGGIFTTSHAGLVTSRGFWEGTHPLISNASARSQNPDGVGAVQQYEATGGGLFGELSASVDRSAVPAYSRSIRRRSFFSIFIFSFANCVCGKSLRKTYVRTACTPPSHVQPCPAKVFIGSYKSSNNL